MKYNFYENVNLFVSSDAINELFVLFYMFFYLTVISGSLGAGLRLN